MIKKISIAFLFSLSTVGCATVDPEPKWQELKAISDERTGEQMIWERSEEEAAIIKSRVDVLLRDGMSRKEAIQIALLNNRMLQASFENIGVAEANLVQAGLLANPPLDFFFAFPISSANSGGGLLAFLSDLWTMPARKKVFEKEAQATIRQVGVKVVDTASEAAMAYDEVLYQKASLKLEEESLQILSEIQKRVKVRFGHGFGNEFDVSQAETEYFDQRVAVEDVRKALTMAGVRLRKALSLPDQPNEFELTDSLEILPENAWNVEELVSFAMKNRLDLAFARLSVEQAENRAGFEKTQVFRNVGIGGAYEGDFGKGSDNSGGPVIGIELPIFDQNQAQIAKADYELRQMKKSLAAAEMVARKQVTDTVAELNFRRDELALLKDKLEPAVKGEIDYAMEWGPRMQFNFLNLLAAQRSENALQREYLQAIWQLRIADVNLQKAIWGGGQI
jgi:cobalt-zinc-cadmium efflux system outer membrane protein